MATPSPVAASCGHEHGYTLSASSCSLAPRVLVVVADDFGYSDARNAGILRAHKEGIVSCTSVLLNGAAVEEGMNLALQQGLPLGLHINLTEGRPVHSPASEVSTLLDQEGFFLGKLGFREACNKGEIVQDHLEREIEAQLDRFLEIASKSQLRSTHSSSSTGIAERAAHNSFPSDTDANLQDDSRKISVNVEHGDSLFCAKSCGFCRVHDPATGVKESNSVERPWHVLHHVDGHQHCHVVLPVAQALCKLFDPRRFPALPVRVPIDVQRSASWVDPVRSAFHNEIARDALASLPLFQKAGFTLCDFFFGASLMGTDFTLERLEKALLAVPAEMKQACVHHSCQSNVADLCALCASKPPDSQTRSFPTVLCEFMCHPGAEEPEQIKNWLLARQALSAHRQEGSVAGHRTSRMRTGKHESGETEVDEGGGKKTQEKYTPKHISGGECLASLPASGCGDGPDDFAISPARGVEVQNLTSDGIKRLLQQYGIVLGDFNHVRDTKSTECCVRAYISNTIRQESEQQSKPCISADGSRTGKQAAVVASILEDPSRASAIGSQRRIILLLSKLTHGTGNLTTARRITTALRRAGFATVSLEISDIDPVYLKQAIDLYNPAGLVVIHAFHCGKVLEKTLQLLHRGKTYKQETDVRTALTIDVLAETSKKGQGVEKGMTLSEHSTSGRFPIVTVLGGTDVNCDLKDHKKRKLVRGCLVSSEKIVAFHGGLQRGLLCTFPEMKDKVIIIPQAVSVPRTLTQTENVKQNRGSSRKRRRCDVLGGFDATTCNISPEDVSLRKRLGISDQCIVVLLVAGLRQVKDPLYAIQLWKEWKLQGHYADSHLAIMGPALDERITQQVKAEVDGCFGHDLHYIAPVPHAQALTFIRQATVVINTSVEEGECNALLEAMALGTPVLCRANDGNCELVKDGQNGMIFANSRDFVSKMNELVTDTSLREFITANGRAYIQAVHSEEIERQKYTELALTDI